MKPSSHMQDFRCITARPRAEGRVHSSEGSRPMGTRQGEGPPAAHFRRSRIMRLIHPSASKRNEYAYRETGSVSVVEEGRQLDLDSMPPLLAGEAR